MNDEISLLIENGYNFRLLFSSLSNFAHVFFSLSSFKNQFKMVISWKGTCLHPQRQFIIIQCRLFRYFFCSFLAFPQICLKDFKYWSDRKAAHLLFLQERKKASQKIDDALNGKWVIKSTEIHKLYLVQKKSACYAFCLYNLKVFKLSALERKHTYTQLTNGVSER